MTSPKVKKNLPKKAAAQSQMPSDTRQVKKSEYKSFRLHKKIKPVLYQLPSSWSLFKKAVITICVHWKLFFGTAAIYGLLMILLVRGFGDNSGLVELKSILNESLGTSATNLTTGAALFVYLLGSSGNSSDSSASAYQLLILLIASLAIIWGLRQVYALKLKQAAAIRVRDGFYRGIYPLVPFLLIILVIIIEFLPAAIGSFLYSTVVQNGIAVETIEKVLWAILFGSSLILSIYLFISTLFALYIVALPDMTPMRALRSARALVRHRRWAVVRKLLLFIFFMLVAAAGVMIPLILFATPLAEWVFFALGVGGLLLVHSYLYALYRELLNE